MTNLLENVHYGLKAPDGCGKITLVQGNYRYYYYVCDGFDDRGWGCGYRTLQTLCSWLEIQLCQTSKNSSNVKGVPTIPSIQKCLITLGDKPESFLGSREWIGSVEVFMCINHFYGVSSKVIHVPSGDKLIDFAETLESHFENVGSPIMMGGDKDASSKGILGIYRSDRIYLLVLVLKQKTLTKKALNSEYLDDRDEDEDKARISTLENQAEAEDSPSHSNSQGANREVISDIRQNSAEPPVSKVGGIKKKRYIPPQKAIASKLSLNESVILTAVDKLNKVSKLAASRVSQKQDIYSHFGDYVGSAVYEIGGQTLILMQLEITNIIFKHMTSLSPYPSVPSHVSSASNPLSLYESSSHGSVVQSMQEIQDNEQAVYN